MDLRRGFFSEVLEASLEAVDLNRGLTNSEIKLMELKEGGETLNKVNRQVYYKEASSGVLVSGLFIGDAPWRSIRCCKVIPVD